LGHTISQHGVATETHKIKNIANWSSPQSVKEEGSMGIGKSRHIDTGVY
jgi:hypothetical protein